MRFGRRARWGPGVFFAPTLGGLLCLALFTWLWAAFVALWLVVGVAAFVAQNTRVARRHQLTAPLKRSLNESIVDALEGRPRVWALYVVGDQFHHGLHPRKGEDLARLYPDRVAQIARVALFPDAVSARSAAASLQRHGYSWSELRSLFPNDYKPSRLTRRCSPPSAHCPR
jgi:hypothetical protein